MKKILEKLDEIQREVDLEIDNREDVFSTRSEKWQESDNGCAYEHDTDQLKEVACSIELSITELSEFLSV